MTVQIDFPANLSTGTVEWQTGVDARDSSDPGTKPDLIPPTGTVTFVASVGVVLNAGALLTILRDPIIGVIDEMGYLCTPGEDGVTPLYRGVELIATDDPDLNPAGWVYNVTYQLRGRSGRPLKFPEPHQIAVPSGTVVNLTTFIPPPHAQAIGIPQATALAAQAAADASLAQAAAAAAQAALIDSEAFVETTTTELMETPGSDLALSVAANKRTLDTTDAADPASALRIGLDDKYPYRLDDWTNGATSAVSRFLKARLAETPSIIDFGADPTGTVDSSAAVAAASAYARLSIAGGSNRMRAVRAPAGEYLLHDVVWDDASTLVGDEVNSTRFVYNGPGGAGSSILINPHNGGATPYTGFRNITFLGYDNRTAGSKMAENAYRMTGTALVDWGFKLENVHVSGFAADAFVLTGIVNFHVDRFRADAINGYIFSFHGDAAYDAPRPVTLKRWTYDQRVRSGETTRLAAQGYSIAATGLGVMNIDTGNGLTLHISDARIEYNTPSRIDADGKRALFRVVVPSGTARVYLENIGLNGVGSAEGVVAVSAPQGRVTFDAQACQMGDLFDYAGDPDLSVMNSSETGLVTSRFSGQRNQGLVINNRRIEWRATLPDTTVFQTYKVGDLIFKKSPIEGRGVGWSCVGPSATGGGSYRPSTATVNGTVATTVDSTIVTITGGTMTDYPVGMNLNIPGAGAAGANHAARVVSRDLTARTLTLSVATPTAVSGVQVTWQQPTWVEFGEVASYGTAAPTTGTHPQGAKVWSTTPGEAGTAGSKYVLMGWVCVAAGTPGTWVPMRVLTGN